MFYWPGQESLGCHTNKYKRIIQKKIENKVHREIKDRAWERKGRYHGGWWVTRVGFIPLPLVEKSTVQTRSINCTHAHAHKQERDDECWRAAIPLSDCWEWERNLKHSQPENERKKESLSAEKRGYTRFGREISPRVSCLTRVCEANKTVELNRQKRRRSRAAAGNRDWFFLVHTPCVVYRLMPDRSSYNITWPSLIRFFQSGFLWTRK